MGLPLCTSNGLTICLGDTNVKQVSMGKNEIWKLRQATPKNETGQLAINGLAGSRERLSARSRAIFEPTSPTIFHFDLSRQPPPGVSPTKCSRRKCVVEECMAPDPKKSQRTPAQSVDYQPGTSKEDQRLSPRAHRGIISATWRLTSNATRTKFRIVKFDALKAA